MLKVKFFKLLNRELLKFLRRSPVSNQDESKAEEVDNIPENASPEQKIADTSTDSMADALEEARKKAAENWDLFLRARADGDNARRRASLDVENAHKYGIEKFARSMLDVEASISHGIEAIKAVSTDNEKALKEGMELTHKMLLGILEKFGVKQIDPMGETFDPMKHEALSTMPGEDLEPNKVMTVIQKGFVLQERVLRPARVIVSKGDH